MKPTRAQIRVLNECSTPVPETFEQASKLIAAMLDNPTIPAQTTAPAATHTTHTPGPWSASHNGNDDVRIFADSVSDSPRCIAKVNTPLNRRLESCANARLIASAPQLLAIAQKILHAVSTAQEVSIDEAIELRAAISQATK